MQIIDVLKINTNDALTILVPNFKEKENCYYKPTKELHMFDIITVIYQTKNITVKKDILGDTIETLKNSLNQALDNKRILPDHVAIGTLGYYYNIDTHYDNDKIDFFNYWLWSSQKIQTWLYTKNNKIYLEICNSYPWLYLDPEENEKIIPFESFIRDYKPILTCELDEKTAYKWIDQTNNILTKMVKV